MHASSSSKAELGVPAAATIPSAVISQCCWAALHRLQLIARMGRWLRTALNLCYLCFFKPQGLLAAAGWPQDQMDAFFAERFCLTFDDDEEMAELAAGLLPVKEAQAMVGMLARIAVV